MACQSEIGELHAGKAVGKMVSVPIYGGHVLVLRDGHGILLARMDKGQKQLSDRRISEVTR